MTQAIVRGARGFGAWAACWMPLAAAGCLDSTRPDPHIAQIQKLEDKVAEQGRLVAQQDAQIASQARLIQDLRAAGDKGRFAQLVRVERIELERLSGGYDDDRDGTPEGVVLYLQLFDTEGDVIKAAGSARARVIDLSGGGPGRVVVSGEWPVDQMRECWFGKLLTSHYTLKLPLGPSASALGDKPLTAVVEFTDLLSGVTLTTQRAFQLAAPAATGSR